MDELRGRRDNSKARFDIFIFAYPKNKSKFFLGIMHMQCFNQPFEGMGIVGYIKDCISNPFKPERRSRDQRSFNRIPSDRKLSV
jgi:hypothetical protein